MVIGLFVVGYLIARLEWYFITVRTTLSIRLFVASVLLTISSGGQRMDVVIPSLVAGALTAASVGMFIQRLFPRWNEELGASAQRSFDEPTTGAEATMQA